MELTVKQYAEKRGISTQAVTQAIWRNSKMPGVKSYRRLSRIWLLTIDENTLKKHLSK